MPRGAFRTIARSVSLFGPHRVFVTFTGIVLPTVNSAEIGDAANNLVVVTFSQAITTSDLSLGVTIKVDGVPVSLSNTSLQLDHLVAFYTLVTPGKANSVVNFIYSDVVGDYTNNQGGALGAVNLTVTNNIGRIMRFNDAPNSMQLWKL